MSKRTMERREELSVFVNEVGGISVEQKDTSGMGEDNLVYLHLDQVPTVIQWLEECLEEAISDAE